MRALTEGRIAAFARYLRGEERSEATVEKYLRDVREFARWLDERVVTKETAAEWKSALLVQELAPATVNVKLSAVNGLFRFLGWEGCRIKLLKIQRKVFRNTARELSRTEYEKLVTAAYRSGQERLALLLETICATGVRVSEVSAVTVDAVRHGQATVRLKGKIRAVLLPAKLCHKLEKYAKRLKITRGEIFLTAGGKPLSRKQIWREMKCLAQKAGVALSKVFPHNLRHLFATEFYRASRDIAKLADILGHSSIETTRIYLCTSGVEHARCMDRLHLVM